LSIPLSNADIAWLEHFQLKQFPNIYTIGMNAGVVSFYSQQSRAFQLAVTLDKAIPDASKPKLKVAVLGGGVAGVTFWMAMQILGFEDSTIFEATHQLLNRQAKSTHRFAHPSINEWPNVGDGQRRFRSTTAWPFANWYASTADDVVRQLRDDRLLQRLLVEKDALVKPNHVIRQITDASTSSVLKLPRGFGLPEVGVSFHTPLGDDTEPFHLVVSALGYGYETDLGDSASKSYWWPDHIGHYSQERHEYGTHGMLVSGTGDGGLIDCIRFARDPHAAPDHNVALEIAAFARRPEFKTLDSPIPAHIDGELSDLENQLNEQFTAHFGIADHPSGPGSPEGKTKAAEDENRLRTRLLAEFQELFKDRKFADQFVRGHELKRIGLVAHSGRVFSPKASVANQILVAFLWGQHHELILRGASIVNRKLENCPVPLKPLFESDKSVMVLRHGARSKLAELLKGASIETVSPSSQDRVVFEQSPQLDRLRDKVAVLLGSSSGEVVHHLASEFASRYFHGAAALVTADLAGDLQVIISLPDSDANDGVYRQLGGYDPEAFGLPLRYSKGHLDGFQFVSQQ
jgi:hypothetical protein